MSARAATDRLSTGNAIQIPIDVWSLKCRLLRANDRFLLLSFRNQPRAIPAPTVRQEVQIFVLHRDWTFEWRLENIKIPKKILVPTTGD